MGAYFSVGVPEWEAELTSNWRHGAMVMHWIGDGDNATLTLTIVGAKGSKVMSLSGGTASPSTFKMTRPMPTQIQSASGATFLSTKQLTTRSSKPVRTIRQSERHTLPMYVRKGNDESSAWDSTVDYSGELPNTVGVTSDGNRVRMWRGAVPDASTAESRKADLLAFVDLDWSRPKNADGSESMSGVHVYRVLWAPTADEWSNDDRCLFMALLTDLFWSNGDMSLHFGGIVWDTNLHPVTPLHTAPSKRVFAA